MRLVIQRVKEASVTVNKEFISKVQKGLLILIGIEDNDADEDIDWLANKVVNLRIFDDENGVMNKSIKDTYGDILVVSQFTLFASTKKGNRPSYIKASRPDFAIPMYDKFCDKLKILLDKDIKKGIFGADMQVFLINDGPVTILIDSKNRE
ncbi:MAG: D-tyrosyl-tRNA(Tyr) deacylase [Paludibacteraceae bacterium]|jgi:D-tyrosyl-tRNA(Tyr) deacylase|nr:D-tyrosyl-tRNA(Tyr) deacylase [Paludibacteraceae bacterium]